MLKNGRKKLKGFSLVEVVIVLVLLAIISGLATNSLSNVYAKTNQAEAQLIINDVITFERSALAKSNEFVGGETLKSRIPHDLIFVDGPSTGPGVASLALDNTNEGSFAVAILSDEGTCYAQKIYMPIMERESESFNAVSSNCDASSIF